MAITLAEAKVGMADKVDQSVIDMFRRSSLLLDKMVFDNCISPGTGGSTLAYGYIQLKTPSTAAVRTINSEYTPGEAKKEKKTTNAVIMGGAFQVDRVLQNTSGAADEVAFQAEQKIKATANYFHNLVINGDTAKGSFDGLKKLLTKTENEITSQVALTTSNELDENYNAFLDEMDALVSAVDGTPSMLLMNGAMLIKLRSIARRAGYYERTKDDFGRVVETYAGVPMIDLGKYYDGTSSKDVVETTDGKTAIYAVSLSLDGFHGISPTGTGVISSYMPDLSAPGAVKTGEVELVAGVVLKNTLKAAVLKDIAIGAAAG
ncbi:MAG: phage capsid protein [Oscillospiraceae bacterium]|nr:phage capsid protein [Oscillospiraceae bacterium]